MKATPKSKPILRLIDCAAVRAANDQRETVIFLSAMLARAQRGDLKDFAACIRSREDVEEMVYTGRYKEPAYAINAAQRMAWRMALEQEQERGD
jgi:hypothetical protein